MVEDLIGPEITSVPIQHVRIKPLRDTLQGGESLAHVTQTAWHQDRGVAHEEADETKMLTVWIAMTDVDETNACLTVIPRAHREGIKPHCPQIQTSIAPGFIDEDEAVALPAKAGGAVLLHPLTPHASLDNGPEKFRWSFDLRYAVTGRAHFPDFVARSRSRPQMELRDASECGTKPVNAAPIQNTSLSTDGGPTRPSARERIVMTDHVRLDASDNVVTIIRPLEAGADVDDVTTTTMVPKGHKVATASIAKSEAIRKYAQVIGYAADDIAPGDHVHTHNVEFRNTDADYEFSTDIRSVKPVAEADRDTFMGYHRTNGSVGTRNYIAVLTSVNCSATAARKIAEAFGPEELADYPNVDGVAAFVHGTGCGMAGSGEGFEALQRVMWGYARHPNHAGVVMVGLGCEMNQIDWLLEAYGIERGPLFHTMNIQDVAGLQRTIELGIEKVRAMLPLANEAERTPCPVSELTVALQCGGSDAWSGITANPALGHACDLLVAQGGTGVLAETPEIYGAEHLLTRRAADEKVGKKLVELIRWWEDYTHRNKGSMDNNPSPGNKKGGLTTILEKSIGAAAKGGTTPLNGIYRYGERVDARGFVFMDSPGYDPASVTGQIASGCNLVTFTTGRGSAFGSKPAPCLKIATNTEMYNRITDDMDINAGTIISAGASVESVGHTIYDRWLRVASGEQTKSETHGLGDYEFVPWQIGATM